MKLWITDIKEDVFCRILGGHLVSSHLYSRKESYAPLILRSRLIRSRFELLENLYNIDSVGFISLWNNSLFHEAKPYIDSLPSVRCLCLFWLLGSAPIILLSGREEGEGRAGGWAVFSCRLLSQALGWDATACSAVGSCPWLAAFCALVSCAWACASKWWSGKSADSPSEILSVPPGYSSLQLVNPVMPGTYCNRVLLKTTRFPKCIFRFVLFFVFNIGFLDILSFLALWCELLGKYF